MRTARELAREYAFANDIVFAAHLDVVARLREMAQEERDRADLAAAASIIGEYNIRASRAFDWDIAADQLEAEIRKAGE